MKNSIKELTVDELAKTVLSPEVESEFLDIDVVLDVKKAGANINFDGIELRIGELNANFHLSGLQITVVLVIVGLASIITQLLLV